ncbi:hypothetical protein M9Y10_043992 [Tritrichomonas musculus]|uniref:Spt20-like SEP domain-containing protein n=1 Tax=Tritrichomonas musculus TaxID=1915356 RepID=A0ABR2K2B9_9EUKA
MKGGRIHFFLPSTKVSCECQTPIVYNAVAKYDNIYDQMHDQMTQTLFFQELRASNTIDFTFMQDFNKRLGYFIANVDDERFDKLTPPSDSFEDLKVGFSVSLLDKNFIIRSDTKKPKDPDLNYPYAKNFMPLIESLETGIIGRELIAVLKKLKVNAWEDGRILCQITDFRFEDPVSYNRLLTVSYNAVSCCDFGSSRAPSQQQKIEDEKRILLLLHPQICTDPSPDVARVKSCLDFRYKMWQNRDRVDPKASEVQEEQAKKPIETGNIELTKLDKKINIPEPIINITKIIQNSTNS